MPHYRSRGVFDRLVNITVAIGNIEADNVLKLFYITHYDHINRGRVA